MGRNLKIKEIFNWKSKNYINKRTEFNNKISIEKILFELISYINPLLWGISKIEYHFLSNGKLKVIISGMKSCMNKSQFIKDELNEICADLPIGLIRSNERTFLTKVHLTQIEFILQELPYNYLDPILLAKSIAGIRNKKGLLGDINFWLENEINKYALTGKINNINANVINGIRIEVRGITGKMTMSKKIIKTFGTLKFNSNDSIIDIGEARNFNVRGILGVKVWISYSTILRTEK